MGKVQFNRQEEFEKICTDTWKDVYRFIYYKVQNREEAEDITQDTYAKALSYFMKQDVKVLDYSSYLKTIAINILRDHWRTRKRKGTLLNLEEVDPVEIAGEDFTDAVNDRIMLTEAMARLTREQETVINLRIIRGLTSAETAHLMNKREGAVRVLQYRAVKALSEILQEIKQRRNTHEAK